MKKTTIKSIVLGTLVGASILSTHAYNVQIWSPVQYVKQLFVTPNGELDPAKATIVFDGINGTIKAKSLYENGKSVATDNELNSVKNSLQSQINNKADKSYVDNKLKNIDTSNLIVKNLKTVDGKYLIKNGKVQGISLTNGGTIQDYNGGTIQDYNGGRRWSDGTYAKSCNGYRHPSSGYKYAGSIGNGTYWIKPNGVSSAFKVYCDMTTDGGGWTRLTYNDGNGKILSIGHSDFKYSTISLDQYEALKSISKGELRILYNGQLYYQGKLHQKRACEAGGHSKGILTNRYHCIRGGFNHIKTQGIAFGGSESRQNIVRLGRNGSHGHGSEIACGMRFGQPNNGHHSCSNYQDYIR